MTNAIGVDIGGSHITVAAVDMYTQQIVPHTLTRSSVNSGGTSNDILDAWCDAIRTCISLSQQEYLGIGIAMPGPFDYEHGISYMKGQAKYEALYGLNLKTKLLNRLNEANDRIRFMNDAACFLQGEVFAGAAKACKNVIGFTLGTGLGSAYYSNGMAKDAELWCSKLNGGIAEDYMSTRWFVKRYRELTGMEASGVREIVASKHKAVDTLFSEFTACMTTFITPLINERQPECVVMGGNIARAADLFVPQLNELFGQTRICKATLGEHAPLLGAASLFSNNNGSTIH